MKITEDILLQRGFIKTPHKILGSTFSLDLGRNRYLVTANIGNANEMVLLMDSWPTENDNLICIHNFDYDGYLTQEKLNTIISIF